MESESSLPYSQEPYIDPYPERDRSSPLSSNPLSLGSILILSSHYRVGLHRCLFPPGFRTKILYVLFFQNGTDN
jgi:hypothetical protein